MVAIKFQTVPEGDHEYRLARIDMPTTPDLRGGFTNRLDIYLGYEKDGQRRQGRGYYLTVIGCATDGSVEKHVLFEDPLTYILLEEAKRFGRKKLESLVDALIENPPEILEKLVAQAVEYYERKAA